MSKLTVQAMDSAAAMEEIVSKLGPDAVILSTTKLYHSQKTKLMYKLG